MTVKTLYLKTTLLLSLLILAGGCVLSYEHDSSFQQWLAAAETRCNERYGALPTMSEDERQTFMKLAYNTYYGETARERFSDKLGVQYPDHQLTIDCLANAFPRLP